MKDMIQYKGYYGSVHYSDDDQVFYGKIEYIKSLVNYEGSTEVIIEVQAKYADGTSKVVGGDLFMVTLSNE